MIGYLRVSTITQEHGLDAQRASITAEAKRRGWQVEWIEDAGKSGKDIDRPGITAALAMLKAREADALVVAKLDRLSRSLADFARLLESAAKQNWSVVALDLGIDTTTPTGKLVANVMAAVAQWERETIGLRTKEALAAAKAKGVHVGRPQGQDPAVVRRIRNLRSRGHTYRAIADRLNGDAVPLPGGGVQWHPNSVRSAEGVANLSVVTPRLVTMESRVTA
ncbi:recombinase family protein [Cryobacterium sp. TMS1-13-1]|uniref:recombinase family protein n=1 Tax=Cryobacterium sp. TMS1-13-1 TaxID=1259220 RepID=UPI001A7E065B|nr:recombinase family protein [Cryobacterium sp. TMS1-13-1]